MHLQQEDATVGMQKQSKSSMGGMSMSMGDLSSSQDSKLVNITDYQTAKILVSKAQELFNSRLMNASSAGTTEKVINDITVAFQELNNSIDNKVPRNGYNDDCSHKNTPQSHNCVWIAVR